MDFDQPVERRLKVLQVFPEIEALGKAAIQRICDDWLQTPLAKEFAVSMLEVDEVDQRLLLSFQCKLTHTIRRGEEYYFPMDELLTFIVEKGVADNERDLAKERIQNARQRSPDVYRKFRIDSGPKLPLFITCKHCDKVLQTQFFAYRNEVISFEPEEIECPACNKIFTIDGTELHFESE